MNILKNKSARALIIIMCALVLFGILIASRYYKNYNSSIDPRISTARTMYEKYNKYAQSNRFDSVFILMDKIEKNYSSLEHYKNSYEIGVLYNNRAASYLTMALYSNAIINQPIIQDSLIKMAENSVNKSISIYQSWLNNFENKSTDEIEKSIKKDFFIGLDDYDENTKNKFLKNRIKEIETAQTETKRRLSVSYTNLGIIYRHKQQYETAAKYYKEALELWDRNLSAENNLHILMGEPLKKRNFIQKMFPPNRNID